MLSKNQPESSPSPHLASADIFMDFDENWQLHRDTLNLAHELELSRNPDNYQVNIGKVALRGVVPIIYDRLIPTEHHRLSFRAKHFPDDAPGDAEVKITLHGDQPRKQIHLVSSKQVVEFGQHKQFQILEEGSDDVKNEVGCDVVCEILDDYVPNPGSTFANLTDPRNDISFAEIAYAMGDTLKKKSKDHEVTKAYTATDARLAVSLGISEVMSGANLQIVEKDGLTTYTLILASPMDWDNGRIVESFKYSFSHSPWRGKGNDRRAMDSKAKIILASSDFSQRLLNAYIGEQQKAIDGFTSGQRALEMIRAAR